MLLRWPREKHCLTLRCRELASALRCGLQPGRVKFRLGASAWWALPGTGGRAVAVEDFGAVGAAGGGGAVGVQGDGPAPLVDRHVMVEETLCRPRDYADLVTEAAGGGRADGGKVGIIR